MTQRYFAAEPVAGPRATLAGAEAHHLAHVMRGAVGDEVTLFDGRGAEYLARVERVGRSEVELAIIARREIDRELPYACTLGVALPKGDRQAWLVEKAVELGVTHLVPLVTERSVAQPVDKALDRLRRGVIEASKQCGRNRLLEIASPQAWPDYLHAAPTAAERLVAHPAGEALDRAAVRPCETWLAVGPEGGLTDAEARRAADTGWRIVSLGPRILRVETAALALACRVTGTAAVE